MHHRNLQETFELHTTTALFILSVGTNMTWINSTVCPAVLQIHNIKTSITTFYLNFIVENVPDALTLLEADPSPGSDTCPPEHFYRECVCVSGEAPDDSEHPHDAIEDSNTITNVETMARYTPEVGQCQRCSQHHARLVRVKVGESP